MADIASPKPGEPGFIGPVPTRPAESSGVAGPTGPAMSLDAVEVSTAELRDYLTAVLTPLETAAADLARQFASAPLDEQLFGPIPEALALARVHRAAHEIYDATLRGLRADVTGLVEKLRACIDSYDCRDADVEADLIRISRGYVGQGGSGFRSESAYQEAVTRARTAMAPASSIVTEPAPAAPPSPPPTGTPGF